MACHDQTTYLAEVNRQIQVYPLKGDDGPNAYASSQAIDPYNPPAVQASWKAQVRAGLAYFTLGADGCPTLVVPFGAPSFVASPPPPQPATDTFYAAGATQIGTQPLGATDLLNAFRSLLSQDPNLDAASRAMYQALVQPGYAYISVSGSSPTLVVPPGAPSATAPCPPGWVAQPVGTTATGTVEEVIGHQLLAIPELIDTTAGKCVPAPTVTACGQWVTVDDCLQVGVLSSVPTSGLILTARILDCAGVLTYMQFSLSGIPNGVLTFLTFALAPGYLLDVCASAQQSTIANNVCWVSIGLQHTCQPGAPLEVMLAQGYVSQQYAVSWPGTTGGVPINYPPQTGPAPSSTVYQWHTGTASVGTSITVSLTYPTLAGDLLVAFCAQPSVIGNNSVTDSAGGVWSTMAVSTYVVCFYRVNCPAGITSITWQGSGGGTLTPPLQVQVFELYGPPMNSLLDVFASNFGANPQTATTGSTSYTDVVLAAGYADNAAGNQFAPQTGYAIYGNTVASDNRRLSSFVANAFTVNPATCTFTASLVGAANSNALVVAFKIHA